MKYKWLIIGAGLSGLMAGLELSRRGEDYIIVEKSKTVPDAKLHYLHSDLQSFFPFRLRPVEIITNLLWENKFHFHASIEMMNSFANATIGKIVQNSTKYIDGQPRQGFVPEAGIENISAETLKFNKGKIMLGTGLSWIDKDHQLVGLEDGQTINYERCISTIPLPSTLELLGIKSTIEFKTEPLHMVEATVPEELYEDLYQILYLPQCDFGFTRVSILGKRIVAEKGRKELQPNTISSLEGLVEILNRLLPNLIDQEIKMKETTNWYGRYIPIKESDRLAILQDLKEKGIDCLGRYAQWTYVRTEHTAKRVVELIEGIKV